jgi:hypothetical protein
LLGLVQIPAPSLQSREREEFALPWILHPLSKRVEAEFAVAGDALEYRQPGVMEEISDGLDGEDLPVDRLR